MQRCTGLAHEGQRRTCNPTSVLYMYFRVVDLGEMMLIGKERPGRALTCLSHSKICLVPQFAPVPEAAAPDNCLPPESAWQKHVPVQHHRQRPLSRRQSRNRRELFGIPSCPEQNITRTRRHFRATVHAGYYPRAMHRAASEAVGKDYCMREALIPSKGLRWRSPRRVKDMTLFVLPGGVH
jgi:hypothetical protein